MKKGGIIPFDIVLFGWSQPSTLTCLCLLLQKRQHDCATSSAAASRQPIPPSHPSLPPPSAICSPASMINRHTLPTVPPSKPVAKLELACAGAQKQTELQHAWPPYQRREGTRLLCAFCLAATTKHCLLFFHLSPHCTLSSGGLALQTIPGGSEDIIIAKR